MSLHAAQGSGGRDGRIGSVAGVPEGVRLVATGVLSLANNRIRRLQHSLVRKLGSTINRSIFTFFLYRS